MNPGKASFPRCHQLARLLPLPQGKPLAVEGQWTAQRRNRERFVTEQPTYSILTRGIENDVLPTCQRYGIGVLSYSPLADGWLSGRYRQTTTQGQRLANRFDLDLPENRRKLEAADQLTELADDAGISLIELAIAFVLRHPPSPGPSSAPAPSNTSNHCHRYRRAPHRRRP